MVSKRKILLRFDDICPTMNWEQWDKAKKMMDDVGVTALLGVVPDNLDPDIIIDEPRADFWDYIKQLQVQGYAIAMHGFHHKFEVEADGIVTKKKRSEFAGLSYEAQLEKIRKGKEMFKGHGIETDIFFAPAHSYDDNTLRALADCDFKYVSDGYSCKPYFRQGIKLLPCRSGGIPKLRSKKGYFTAVVHAHEWVREDRQIEWKRYQNLLANHASEIESFEEFKNWQIGNNTIQRFVEGLYFFAKQNIAPIVFKLKKKISK